MAIKKWRREEVSPVDRLPDHIRVGPFDIKIIKWSVHEAVGRSCFGEFSGAAMYIALQQDMPSPIKAVDTLLHEVIHAIFWTYRILDEDKEERTATLISRGMTQVHRDNAWLAPWIAETLS